MSSLTDPLGPDLTATLRALKLGKLTATLPERLTLARQHNMPHADFLQLVLSDEVARREADSIALRAKNAGLDPAMRTETWDPTAAIHYDQRLWNELVSLRFLDGPHGALCFASEFLNHSILQIPSHGPARLTGPEADHHVGSDHELAQGAPEAGAQREVRDLRVGADRAGHPARSRGEVEGGPLDGGAHLPHGPAGRAGRAIGVGARLSGHDRRAGCPGRGRGGERAAAGTVTEQAVALHLHEGKARWD